MTSPTKLPDPTYKKTALFPMIKCYGSAVVSPGAITTGSTATGTITVLGAAIGDYVMSSYSTTLSGCVLDAYVSDGDTITWVITNATGGTVTPAASSTIRVFAMFINDGAGVGI